MPLLYDHRNQPINEGTLSREHADPEDDWLRPVTDSVADTLTPERLAALMRAADEGDVDSYLTLAEEMEEREPQYRSTLSQRKFAVCSSQIVVEAASDDAGDVERADAVRELSRQDAFHQLLLHMQDALGKCYSITEILWNTDGPGRMWWPGDYRWRDPRWYRLDSRTLCALRLQDANLEGTELPPAKYVVHHPHLKSGLPARGGLARIVAIAYAAKRFSAPHLVRFLEVMGIPARIGKYPKDGYTTADKRDLLRNLRRLGSDASAIVPEGVTVELLEARGRGGPAEFVTALNFWDSQISKAVVGQTMTTDAGSSKSQSETHYAVRLDFTQHDNRQTSATLNRDLVRPFIDLNFGPQERYPRILLHVEQAEDTVAFATAVSQLVDRGLRVDQREVRRRLGLSEPEEGAELLASGVGRGPHGADEGAEGEPDPQPPIDPTEEPDEGAEEAA
ncbi:MAG: DUF935 family protein [Sandaracinaceae bacterium]